MSEGRRESEPTFIVATDDRSFGGAVVTAIEQTGPLVRAERVESVTSTVRGRDTDNITGTVVDGHMTESTAVVERLTESADLPVVVLVDSTLDDDTVADVLTAGATDVLPRTTTVEQYELAVERLVDEDSSAQTRAPTEGDGTYRQAYEALFERISEGLVVHDPETGEITDANERFCEMNGYERSELLGEPIGTVLTETDEYGPHAAEKLIQRARTEGPQQFEWRNRHQDGETVPVEVDLTVIELGGAERVLASVQDITERKRREREYEQIFNGVNDSITIHDPETGELLEVNDAFCELLGYDRDEIIESGVMEYTPSGRGYTAEKARRFIDEVLEAGGPKRTEWAVETADGDVRQLEVTGTIVEIGGDRRYVAIDRDITERRRREREYEQIFNGVNDGLTIHDTDTGKILDANETYLEIFGYDDVETVRELGIEALSVTEDGYTRERARTLISDVASTEEPRTVEWRIETADGEHRWLESTVAPAKIAGEKRALAIQRDITERKRREREFEQIFNGVQDAISVHDPDTVEILDANDAYLDMFGYTDLDEVRELGVSGLSVTEEGYTERRGRAVHQRVAESGNPETLEWRTETRSGERIWLEVTVTPATIGGEQRTIAIQRDVTGRKRRTQRLEVFDRILRHNLRNQLDVIRSHAETLAGRTTDDHAQRIIHAVTQLAATGRRARRIDRVISRDETLTETDIAETLRGTIQAVKPTQSDVTVTTDFAEDARLWTDAETMRLALEGALENAFEYAASNVTVSLESDSEECVIRISDDGPGIPAEALAPIQAGTETMLQHGRGLGLWQLKWSVNELNGDLSFETGPGTTVRITVPDRSDAGRSD